MRGYDRIMRLSRLPLALVAACLASPQPALAEPDAAASPAPAKQAPAPATATSPIPASIARELASGDGKSQETAYVVFEKDEMSGVDKEYEVLRYLGLKPSGQALVTGKTKTYDAMTVVDPRTGATSTVWFDISKFFGKLF